MERESPQGNGATYGNAKRSKKAPAVGSPSELGGALAGKAEITLVVDDPATAAGIIEESVTRLGGRINGHSYSDESHLLIIRIGTQKVPALLGRLERIGTVQERPQLPKGATGTVDLTIRW